MNVIRNYVSTCIVQKVAQSLIVDFVPVKFKASTISLFPNDSLRNPEENSNKGVVISLGVSETETHDPRVNMVKLYFAPVAKALNF